MTTKLALYKGKPLLREGIPVVKTSTSLASPTITPLSAERLGTTLDADVDVAFSLSSLDGSAADVSVHGYVPGSGRIPADTITPSDAGPFRIQIPGARVLAGETIELLAASRDSNREGAFPSRATIVFEEIVVPVENSAPVLQGVGGGPIEAGGTWEVLADISGDVIEQRRLGFQASTPGDDDWVNYELSADTSALEGYDARARVLAYATDGTEYEYLGDTETVLAAPTSGALDALTVGQWGFVWAVGIEDGFPTSYAAGIRLTDAQYTAGHDMASAGRVAWSGSETPPANIATQWNKCTKATGFDTPGAPGYRVWVMNTNINGIRQGWADRLAPDLVSGAPGETLFATVAYSTDDPNTTPIGDAVWSAASDRKSEAAPPKPTVPFFGAVIQITGTATAGETQSATYQVYGYPAPTLLFNWYRGGTAAQGSGTVVQSSATLGYPTSVADVGSKLRLEIVASNGLGTTVGVSDQSETITTGGSAAPVFLSPPVQTGGPVIGSTLVVTDNGEVTGNPAPTFAFQWKTFASGTWTNVSGQTSASWTPGAGRVGESLSCFVTAANIAGSVTAQTNIVTMVAQPQTTAGKHIMLYAPEEKAAGVRGGDGGQWCIAFASCRDYPEHILAIQDSGGVHNSWDFGRIWRKGLQRGMRSRLGACGMIDPKQPLIRFIGMCGNATFPDSEHQDGVYFTGDGGLTYTRVVVFDWLSERIHQHNFIGFHPLSETAGTSGKAMKWIAMPRIDLGADAGSIVLYATSTGGATTGAWARRTTFNGSNIGYVSGIKGDPTDDNAYFVSATTGLWRLSNAHTGSAAMTKISGTRSLPNGSIPVPTWYLSDDGATMIVGISQGIYKRTTYSGNFSKVGSYSPGALSVNPYDPSQMIDWLPGGTQKHPWYSSNGGTSFTEATSQEGRPPPVGNPPSGGSIECYVFWRRPTASDQRRAYYFGPQSGRGNGCLSWYTNNGLAWFRSDEGFGGTQLGGGSMCVQLDHPANRLISMVGLYDFGACITRDGWQSFGDRNLRNGDLSPGLPKGFGNMQSGAMHPQFGTGVGRDYCIGLFGEKGSNGIPILFNGTNWVNITTETSQRTGQNAGYDLDNPAYCYLLDWRSTNHGLNSWAKMGNIGAGFTFCGMTETWTGNGANGQMVYAWDLNAPSALKYSVNRGSNWTVARTFPSGTFGNFPIFVFHPSIPGRCWIEVRGVIRYYPDIINSASFTTINPTAGVSGFDAFGLSGFAVDCNNQNHIAVRNNLNGTGYQVGVSYDGGASFEPQGPICPDMAINVMRFHRLTGDLIISTSNGLYMKPAPTGKGFSWPAASLAPGIQQPSYVYTSYQS